MAAQLWRSRLLSLGALVETLAGLGLLIDPAGGAALLLGASLDTSARVIARLGGGALLALGIACWSARPIPCTSASRGTALALMFYNAVAAVMLVWARVALAISTPSLLTAAVFHGLFAMALLADCLAARESYRLDR